MTAPPQAPPTPRTNLEAASLVARVVQIDLVRLREARLRSTPDAHARGAFKAEQTAAVTLEVLRERLRVLPAFQLVIRTEAEEPTEFLHFEALYQVEYTLTDGSTFPSAILQAFADLNGMYNTYPYWRELVQSVVGRAGLGALTLPVWRPSVTPWAQPVPPAEPPSTP